MSGTSRSIRTKLWWNSHLMVLFQNCVRQSRSPTKMAATVQLHCYWKQLWSRWAITGSWEPLVSFGHCVVCPLIYRFWLPCWYLQTLLKQLTLNMRSQFQVPNNHNCKEVQINVVTLWWSPDWPFNTCLPVHYKIGKILKVTYDKQWSDT